MRPFRSIRTVGALLLTLAGLGLAAPGAAAQEAYTLRGTVVDATTQRPLASVNVALRGTSARVATNAQGQYALVARVQPGAYVLEFTTLGRGLQTVPVTLGAERAVAVPAVSLRETAVELQGLVVTGTGAPVERRQVGNTVATVSGEAVSEAPGASAVDQALQGKIAGALITENSGQPGGGVSIRLRGTSSIYGSAEPLIVIDGVLVDNNSEALVGLGANATRGNAALSNRLSDIAPGDIERVEVLKGAAAAALYGSRANSGVIQIFTKRGRQGTPQVTFRTELQANDTDRRLRLNMVPVGNRADSIASSGAIRPGAPVQRFDYQDRIFQTGYGINNQASVSGGTEGTTYYLSGNWEQEDGILRSTSFDRASARARVNQRLSGALELGLNLSYLRSQANYVPEGEQGQGLFTQVVFTPTYYNPARNDTTGRFPYSPVLGPNPFDIIENWEASSDVQRFLGSVNAGWTPAPGLTVSYLAGLDDSREENVYFQPVGSMSAAFTGSIQNPIRSIRKFNNDFTVNYETGLGAQLASATTAGLRYTDDRVNIVRAAASDLPPGGSTVIGAVQTASQSITQLRTLGGFVQQRLTFRDRITLTAGLNTEASSAFGSNQRWQAFPRAGLSYIASDEPGFADGFLGRYLSTLRLRAAYGQTGGQPPSEYLAQVTYLNVSYAGRPGLRPNTLAPNADLKPERQREWEAGFEAGALDDRLSVEFTYYDKETSDLLLLVPQATSTGFANQWQNIGRLSNKGVELALSSVNVDRESFRWTSRLLYARNRNRVEQLNARSDTIVFDYLNAVIEGQPLGVFYGAYYPRDADGNIILAGPRDARGFPIAGAPRIPSRARAYSAARNDSSIIPRKIIGDPTPDFTASFANEFRIGDRLELNVLLDGQFGNDVANFTRRTADFFGASANAGLESSGDTVAGTFTRNSDRNLLYEEFIEDGSFVKLREIGVGVRFEDPWVRRLGGAERMTLRVAARNLFTWTDYSGLDPEVNMFSASTVSRGVDFATTPIPRTLSVGLTFEF